MLEFQDNIAKAQAATVGLRHELAEEAAREYFRTLDPITSPAAGDFTAAEARACMVLKQQLLSHDALSAIDGGAKLDENAAALVALSFDAVSRPLRIPGPTAARETKTFTLALAAAVGAVAGMLGLAPLMRLAFENRDLGLVLGGPLGAWLAVLAAQRLARIRLLTRILPWVFTKPKALRGAVRSEHEKAVRMCIEQWVDWAVPMLAILCVWRSGVPEVRSDKDKALRRIGKLIYALHQAEPQLLPVVAHELLQEAKNSGFEGLEGPPVFLGAERAEQETVRWKPDLQSKYEAFGHIVEGDQVVVERPAVIFGGQVVQRGLVRKVRDRR
jgi:hypothetical protein